MASAPLPPAPPAASDEKARAETPGPASPRPRAADRVEAAAAEAEACPACLRMYTSLRQSHTTSCPSAAAPTASHSPSAEKQSEVSGALEADRACSGANEGSSRRSNAPDERPAASSPAPAWKLAQVTLAPRWLK